MDLQLWELSGQALYTLSVLIHYFFWGTKRTELRKLQNREREEMCLIKWEILEGPWFKK